MKRERAIVACHRCRTLKVKCSGEDPCARCKRFKISCSFPGIETTNSNLKSRRIAPVKASLSSTSESDTATKILTNDTHDPTENDYVYAHQQWRTNGRSQTVILRDLCLSSTSDLSDKPHYKVPRFQYYGWNLSGIHYRQKEKLPQPPKFDFSHCYKHLLRYFFTEINPFFNLLGSDFLEYFSNNFQSFMKAATDDSSKQLNNVLLHSATLHLVLALSIRFTEFLSSEGPRKEMLEVQEQCAAYSYHVLHELSFEYFSLEVLQGWLIVVLYLRITHTQRSLLTALDRANCMARNMGLHTNRAIMTKTTPIKAKAQQTFWSIYAMDQLFSLQLGRQPFWRNDDITIPFPDQDILSEFNLPDGSVFFAIHQLALVAHDVLTVRWRRVPRTQVSEAGKKIQTMHNWLVDNEYMTDSSTIDILLGVRSQVRLHFHDIVFYHHSPVLFNYVGKPYHHDGVHVEDLFASMEDVIHVIKLLQQEGLLKVPWYNPLTLLFSIGTFSLAMVNGGYLVTKARQMFAWAIGLLGLFGSYRARDDSNEVQFPMAKECVWALKQGLKCMMARFQHEMSVFLGMEIEELNDSVNNHKIGLLGEYGEYSKDFVSMPNIAARSTFNSEIPSATNEEMNEVTTDNKFLTNSTESWLEEEAESARLFDNMFSIDNLFID